MPDNKNKPAAPGHEATVLMSSTGVEITGFGAAHPDGGRRTLNVGDVLNNMFKVERFIARGGMGEVFEGINIASDERVAIKVMLPGHAGDSKLLALFRREARTLTRLNHPALVQYRVLAQEPRLGVFYIVTEFVDGANLSDVIGRLDPTPRDLLAFTRRLATGLEAAHTLGAIHRDLSPDNVMLQGGLLSGARIIDFGIAKELNDNAATIIGDSFAGKLNYVAPEQLGDFNRTIGPWTDVYSLGLVVLAVATHRHVDMGGTLVSAVDRRRAGPDLSETPEEVRPLLARMLKPNPEERIQSMHELLDLITSIEAGRPIENASPQPVPHQPEPVPPATAQPPAIAEPENIEESPGVAAAAWSAEPAAIEPLAEAPALPGPEAKPATPLPQPSARPAKEPGTGGGRLPVILAGGAVAVPVIAAALWFTVFSGKDDGLAADEQRALAPSDRDSPQIRAGLAAALPTIGCAWLDLADVRGSGQATTAVLRGVSGNPADLKRQIGRVLTDRKLALPTLDTTQVASIAGSECVLLDALRQIRSPAGGTLFVPQQKIEMTKPAIGDAAGATVTAEFNLADPTLDLALLGIESSGKLTQLTTGRRELVANSEDLGNGRYRVSLDVDHTGWSGLIVLTGSQPFDRKLLAGAPGSRTGDWSQQFLAAAKERNWKAEMIWFRVVDEQPN
ncbi:serine/threonine protein kinase [Novosphingobium album (ex Liu et al. 2023)]|uniref:Protein kinase n=1 Tax=Novosphingobium album (ex Liu et al. 2023) TaxID=3031130 RepID=A0ABT5WV12_9SPHN|nr:serine/threonine protein kinase [Novosphingobium album (ex Liu et al. 2023)]MDE8653693.1 protein kinase [Novosphingobium album (ex Liu et al. 2023)]